MIFIELISRVIYFYISSLLEIKILFQSSTLSIKRCIITSLKKTNSIINSFFFPGDQLIAMDGHNLLNLKYEEAMKLFHSSGAEVELLLSQTNKDKRISESQEEPCAMKAVGKDNEFQLPVTHELDCGETSLNSVVHPETVKSLGDSYLKNGQYKMAAVGGESEMLSPSVATPMKSMQQLRIEKPSTPARSSCDSNTEGDRVSTGSSGHK
jgi:hypothetical protein